MTSNNDLTLEQKASLLSGNGFWATKAVEEAGIPARRAFAYWDVQFRSHSDCPGGAGT